MKILQKEMDLYWKHTGKNGIKCREIYGSLNGSVSLKNLNSNCYSKVVKVCWIQEMVKNGLLVVGVDIELLSPKWTGM